jgi:phage-related protein
MIVVLAVRYFRLEGQRSSPADDAITALPARFRAAIRSDIEAVAEYGIKAPASIRTITGQSPMMEIRTGQYRTLFIVDRGELWILGCCKKQDQRHAIGLASERMKLVLER